MCRDVTPQSKQKPKLGGNRAALFVYATPGLENMTFIANALSLVTYFFGYMNFSLAKSATTLTNFLGTSFMLALFGGLISDTYLSRFRTSILFGGIEVLGYTILTAQAHFPELRPVPCKDMPLTKMNQCEVASSGQVVLLFAGLYLVALGTSGEAPSLSSFFNWLLFSITIGAIFGVTFLVWISTNQGWDWSFGVCTVAVLVGFLFLAMGKSIYRNKKPKGSPMVRILQVLVAAIRNRNLPVPEMAEELHELREKEGGIGSEILHRTNQFRFLDRAAIVRSTGEASTFTVTQVEETKIILRMLPIILSTILMSTCLAQLQTFTIQQSTTMDRSLLGFQVPGPSVPVIPLLFMFILLPIYDRIFVPVARKITGIPTGITHLQRIGVGLVLSIISMAVAGVVETLRKNVATKHICVFWLGVQYSIFGIADMFTLVGLLEFFYAESSSRMKSLSTGISWCSMAFGYYTSSVTVEVVNRVSGGWLASNNLIRDKLNYFYWLLAVLSTVNFGVYLVCASWYKYKKVEMGDVEGKGDCQGNIETGRV
ncbi:hypothetical protein NMG60_11024283 [Bertholletia excelsa]